MMSQWTRLAQAHYNRNQDAWNSLAKALVVSTHTQGEDTFSAFLFSLELVYNKLHLMDVGLWLCCGMFLLFILSKILNYKFILTTLNTTYLLCIIIVFSGIIMRMAIMQRPPVSTLYESVIFVALVVLFLGAFLLIKKHTDAGVLLGSLLGGMLLLVAKGYEKNGDTMGTLIAVLDTNFWLATHVVTITIGYAFSAVVALLAHMYIVRLIRGESSSVLTDLFSLLRYNTLLALFFTVLGTILGGIWADQSWGRFWGWDPKENGALLLAMWMVLLLHGWHGKFFRQTGYAFVASMSGVILVLSWFGVNLLNVGLHSYGFTQNIAMNMIMFGGAEIVFLIVSIVLMRRNDRKTSSS